MEFSFLMLPLVIGILGVIFTFLGLIGYTAFFIDSFTRYHKYTIDDCKNSIVITLIPGLLMMILSKLLMM